VESFFVCSVIRVAVKFIRFPGQMFLLLLLLPVLAPSEIVLASLDRRTNQTVAPPPPRAYLKCKQQEEEVHEKVALAAQLAARPPAYLAPFVNN
jgi:hypothetical protein